jgi:hypothetical protein
MVPPGVGPEDERSRPSSRAPRWAWLIGIVAVGLLVIAFIVGNLTYRPVGASIDVSTECGSTFLPRFVSTFSRTGCDTSMATARYLTIGLSAAATLIATRGAARSSTGGPPYAPERRSLRTIGIVAGIMLAWSLGAWGLASMAAYEPS